MASRQLNITITDRQYRAIGKLVELGVARNMADFCRSGLVAYLAQYQMILAEVTTTEKENDSSKSITATC